jgi:hypothetical protein
MHHCVTSCAFHTYLRPRQSDDDVLNFRAKGFSLPSDWKVFCQGVKVHVSPWLLGPMINFPSPGLTFLCRHVELPDGIARRLIQSRLIDADDVDRKDALSRIGTCPGPFLQPSLVGRARSDSTYSYSVKANRSETERLAAYGRRARSSALVGTRRNDNRHGHHVD